jgi:hypothetical protein
MTYGSPGGRARWARRNRRLGTAAPPLHLRRTAGGLPATASATGPLPPPRLPPGWPSQEGSNIPSVAALKPGKITIAEEPRSAEAAGASPHPRLRHCLSRPEPVKGRLTATLRAALDGTRTAQCPAPIRGWGGAGAVSGTRAPRTQGPVVRRTAVFDLGLQAQRA